MAFTVMGNDHYPSAGHAVYDSSAGTFGSVSIAAEGFGQDEGFTGYKALVGDPPRPRWAITAPPSLAVIPYGSPRHCTLPSGLAAWPTPFRRFRKGTVSCTSSYFPDLGEMPSLGVRSLSFQAADRRWPAPWLICRSQATIDRSDGQFRLFCVGRRFAVLQEC